MFEISQVSFTCLSPAARREQQSRAGPAVTAALNSKADTGQDFAINTFTAFTPICLESTETRN